jgi:hypothetical protein
VKRGAVRRRPRAPTACNAADQPTDAPQVLVVELVQHPPRILVKAA